MASMKLRVRAAAGGQTIRVQVPVLCTLQHLKTALAPMILCPVSAIRLSLNKRDELEGPGDALLSSFGLTSGDLLYYIVNDSGRSPFPNPGLRATPNVDGERRAALPTAAPDGGTAGDRTPPSRASEVSDEDRAEAAGRSPSRSEIRSSTNPISRRELCAAAADRRAGALVAGSGRLDSGPVSGDSPLPEAPDSVPPPPSKKSSKRGADMGAEGDEMEPARDGDLPGHRPAVPIPYILHRVLASEFGNVRHAPSYLVLAVHAMMLETGFVRVNAGEGSGSSAAASVGYGLPAGWSDAGVVNLTYSLPELVRAGQSPASGRAVGEEALLRCRIVGNAVVVYGAVTGGSVHRVSLSVSKFVQEKAPLGRSAISGESGSSSSGGGADGDPSSDLVGNLSPSCSAAGAENLGTNVYRDILDLWKDGKDSLSIPLLTFMCEAAGLDPPPSLLRLPTEMKLKVLDSLPPIALANVACACSELRFLAASEELWKQRYVDEFGISSDKPPGARGWKSAFVRDFKRRKGWEEDERAAARRLNAVFPPVPFFPPFPAHFGRVDYLPGLGRTLPTDVDRFVPNPLLPHQGGPDYLPELGGTLPIDMDPLRRNALLPNHVGPFPGDRVNGGSIEGFDFGGLVPHPRFNFNGQSAPHVNFPDLRGMDRSRRSR